MRQFVRMRKLIFCSFLDNSILPTKKSGPPVKGGPLFLSFDFFDGIARVFHSLYQDLVRGVAVDFRGLLFEVYARMHALDRVESALHARTAMRTTHAFDH